jgi:molybdate transport system ATP-binding protein
MPPMKRAGTRYLEVRLGHINLQRAGRLVLKGINWTIRPGQRWVLAGANGAGKTQLLKLIAGAVWPAPSVRTQRHYVLGGTVSGTPFEIRDEIAYLGAERQDRYQRYGWNMPVERVAGTGLYRSDIPLDALSRADRARVRAVLRRLGVAQLARRGFLSLSYGERRVVLLARALLSRPRLLLLDEVLNGLDEVNRARLGRWLARQTGALPWVLATHRLQDVPASATHALVLGAGRIVYAGALRGAPLARWLTPPGQPRRRAAAPRRHARGARVLVRLAQADVYLDARRVLSGISLSVRVGEFWVVHGRNGSGKTTLLRTLYGDHGVAVGGDIERDGVDAGVPLERFRRRVGLIAPHLQAEHPHELSVTEVVQSGRHASIGLAAAASGADRAAARRVLRSFGLTRFATRTLGELSYGESRRVLFARALVRAPELLLLDEPFAGIDAPTRAELLERVLALSAAGVTVVVSAHGLREWRGCATHEVELAEGRARYCGAVRRSARRPRSAAREAA